MKKPSKRGKIYSMDDLKNFVQNFNTENSRLPNSKDIRKLSKSDNAPSEKVFHANGGLTWVIKQAGFEVPHEQRRMYNSDEVKTVFASFVRNFIAQHGRVPESKDFKSGIKEKLCPSGKTIKIFTRKTIGELMYDMGFSIKRPFVISRRRDGL